MNLNNDRISVKHVIPVRLLRISATLVTLALLWSMAGAQTAPDAGSLLQQIDQQRGPVLPPKADPPLPPPAPMQSIGGEAVSVKSFTFAGNTLLGDAQLQPAVAGFLNRPLTFSELQNAAAAAATAYRDIGFVVRVYLPQQDITGGVVKLQVIEARFGKAAVQGEAQRVAGTRLVGIVEAAQPRGEPLRVESLDRALLLIDDLPGVSVTGRLSEGEKQAETDLVLSANDGSRFNGEASLDNTGSRSTGIARAAVSVSLNSPLRLGDQLTGFAMHTKGSDYLRVAYSMPVGYRGLRVGTNASHLSYKVVTPEFAMLDAHGTSRSIGLDASYPLVRSRLKNLYAAVTFDDKHFDNESAGAATTKYDVRVAGVGLNGNLFDDFGGGGATSANIALVMGTVDLGGSPNQAADAATTQTAGRFKKLRFATARQQTITQKVSLYASLSSQSASKNLDSSEKFYLGGPTGVRAYPSSEGGGSEGHMVNVEVRSRLPANLNLTGFYDAGTVTVNKDNAILGAAVPNHLTLKGLGVSLAWTSHFGLTVKGTLARRIGDNPNPTVTGNDQDGSLKKNRLWLQASLPF